MRGCAAAEVSVISATADTNQEIRGMTEEENARRKKFTYVCVHCGSERVLRDAWAAWDSDSQSWELTSVFDAAHCEDCEGETTTKPIELASPIRSNLDP
jgi:DNA-directed RNA polymerase subunit RPC12/RpoP